jgi:hypothetical protein
MRQPESVGRLETETKIGGLLSPRGVLYPSPSRRKTSGTKKPQNWAAAAPLGSEFLRSLPATITQHTAPVKGRALTRKFRSAIIFDPAPQVGFRGVEFSELRSGFQLNLLIFI